MKAAKDLKMIERRFWTAAIVLFIAGCSTCYLGVEYEISKIPADVRAEMTDFDWIGDEWVFGSMGIQLLSLLAVVFALNCARKVRELTPHLACGCIRHHDHQPGCVTRGAV